MTLEKTHLRLDELEAQTALELPDRETLGSFVDVNIKCLGVCVGEINIYDIDVNTAVNVCAQVSVLSNILQVFGTKLVCTAKAS